MSEATTTLTPHLACRNAAEAAAFYQQAFGAEPITLMELPDGRVMHAALSIEGAVFFLADEFPEHGGHSPQSLGGSPVTLHLQVPDCDAVFRRAVEAGCEAIMPPEDMFWGDRYGQVADPYGHKWSIGTTVRQVSPEEMRQAISSFSGSEEGDGSR
jgi:PhnB protein